MNLSSKKQTSAHSGDDDILGAITDMCLHDMRINNFTFRGDSKKSTNCFPYISLKRYEERQRGAPNVVVSFLVCFSSREVTSTFPINHDQSSYLSKQYQKKYPKRLMDNKSWPDKQRPDFINIIFIMVQEAIRDLESAYHTKKYALERSGPESLELPTFH